MRTRIRMCCTTLGSEQRREAGETESRTPGQNTAPWQIHRLVIEQKFKLLTGLTIARR